MLIAFPPCQYLAGSGMHWTRRGLRDPEETERALALVAALLDAPIDRIALENPVGVISSRIRPPDQTIQPYLFGDDASKRTCIWLKGLPRLRPTAFAAPRLVEPADQLAMPWGPAGVERWANQTDAGQNRLSPSAGRAAERAATYPGIARAMAAQWGGDARQGATVLSSPIRVDAGPD